MRIIDSHVHLYDVGFWSPCWFDYVAEGWASSDDDRQPEHVRGRIEPGMADPDGTRLLAQMTAAGIDASVVLTLDWELGFPEATPVSIEEIHARYARAAAASEGRLRIFAGVDPRRPNAVEIFETAIREYGMCGLKLYPPTGFHAYDPVVYPLYERCAEWGLPVLIHTGGTIGLLRPRFARPADLQDIQADFPNLTIWFGHSGGAMWWEEAIHIAANGRNSYLELSNLESIAYTDEERFLRTLSFARDMVGAERILFGSDHFSGDSFRGEDNLVRWVDFMQSIGDRARGYGLDFSDEEVQLIMGENAARCLGLEGR